MQAAEAITEAERKATTPPLFSDFPPPPEPDPEEPEPPPPPVRSGPSLDGAENMSLKDLLRDHELEVRDVTGGAY